jgi:hypothetical protein
MAACFFAFGAALSGCVYVRYRVLALDLDAVMSIFSIN